MVVRSAPFWLSFSLAATAAAAIAWGGMWMAATPVLVFLLVPVFDVVGGHARANPVPDAVGEPRLLADLPLFVWVLVQLGLIVAALVRVRSGELEPGELVALAAALGLCTGAGGINVAHELMHRAAPTARAAAEVLMTSVSYTHFCVEHVHGHHRHVATPDDPASARKGEGLFRFWLRSLAGGLVSAIRIESKRARTRGLRGLRDRRIRYALDLALAYAIAGLIAGAPGLAFMAGQSLVAILLLETINYIEHYGLHRRQLATGGYERVRPEHSWNASQRVTNWLLFNLQRHSDHHYIASRPYWALRHYDEVPQLPFGYATAVLTALVPPLWRRVMDPRVEAWERAREEADR